MEKQCTGSKSPENSLWLISIDGWHGKFGHLNVYTLDHNSVCTGYGKHNRIVNYGDFSGRIDKVWELRNPTEKEIVSYYKKEWNKKGKYKVIFTYENDDAIYFELVKVEKH